MSRALWWSKGGRRFLVSEKPRSSEEGGGGGAITTAAGTEPARPGQPSTPLLLPLHPQPYRGTSLIRNCPTLVPYSSFMSRVLWCSKGGRRFLMSEKPRSTEEGEGGVALSAAAGVEPGWRGQPSTPNPQPASLNPRTQTPIPEARALNSKPSNLWDVHFLRRSVEMTLNSNPAGDGAEAA